MLRVAELAYARQHILYSRLKIIVAAQADTGIQNGGGYLRGDIRHILRIGSLVYLHDIHAVGQIFTVGFKGDEHHVEINFCPVRTDIRMNALLFIRRTVACILEIKIPVQIIGILRIGHELLVVHIDRRHRYFDAGDIGFVAGNYTEFPVFSVRENLNRNHAAHRCHPIDYGLIIHAVTLAFRKADM